MIGSTTSKKSCHCFCGSITRFGLDVCPGHNKTTSYAGYGPICTSKADKICQALPKLTTNLVSHSTKFSSWLMCLHLKSTDYMYLLTIKCQSHEKIGHLLLGAKQHNYWWYMCIFLTYLVPPPSPPKCLPPKEIQILEVVNVDWR